MNKYTLLILVALGLISCSRQDTKYYLSNPMALQEALKKCPDKHPSTLSCQQLENIGKRMNELGAELQSNPQGFGVKIIKLQKTISEQQVEFDKNKQDRELKANLDRNRQELSELMAVVKWLESPENS